MSHHQAIAIWSALTSESIHQFVREASAQLIPGVGVAQTSSGVKDERPFCSGAPLGASCITEDHVRSLYRKAVHISVTSLVINSTTCWQVIFTVLLWSVIIPHASCGMPKQADSHAACRHSR